MKNKVLIFKGQNNLLEMEYEINQSIAKANRTGYRVVSLKTTVSPWGDRQDADYVRMPMHVFYVTTILLEKEV